MLSESHSTQTGREFDTETSLYYYRARYYDANTGRFLTEDPIEFHGGDANFYGYVRNRPTRFIDPRGLIAIDPTFNVDCLPALKRALSIIHGLPKKCNCVFGSNGQHRSLDDLMADPGIPVRYNSQKTEDPKEVGRTDFKTVMIDAQACRMGRWTLAVTIVHELAHINFGPSVDNQDDRDGPPSSSAYGVERACGFLPERPTSTTPPAYVSGPPSIPIETENSPILDGLILP